MAFLAAGVFIAGVFASGQQTAPPPGSRPSAPVTNAAAAAASQGTAAISGVIIDAITGLPVANAIVSISRAETRVAPLPRMVTDARGRFVIRNLAPAPDYFLDARAFGYASTRYGWTGPGQSPLVSDIKRIALTDDQWVSDIRIPLWRLGSINGRVVDERNEPVVGVAVRAFTTAHVSGQPQLVAGPIATTDDRGVYRIAGLHPGQYLVAVLSVQSTVLMSTPERPQLRPIGELATGGIGGGNGAVVTSPALDVGDRYRLVISNFATPPPPSATQPRAYAAVFFPAATTADGATRLEINYGDQRRGIDFQLTPVPTARVSGHLESASRPLPALLLRMLPRGGERLGFGFEAATTVAATDGSFTFLNVPSGEYTVIVQPSVLDFTAGSSSTRMPDAPGFPAGGISVGSFDAAPGLGYLNRRTDSELVWSRTAIDVGGRDVEDLVVALQPTVIVRGRAVFAEGTKTPTGPFLVAAEPADGNPLLGYPTGSTDAAFAFTLKGLWGGRYLLRSWSAMGIVSVMWNGRDMARSGLDASLGQDFEDVVVTFTDKRIEVRGVVGNVPDQATAAVIAFPFDRDRWTDYGWNPSFFKVTRAGESGDYRLSGLSEGEYYIVAVNASQRDAWVNPKFLAAAVPVATRVSLRWGDAATHNLTFADVKVK